MAHPRLRHHLRAPLAAASVSLHAWHFDDNGPLRFSFFWNCKGVKGVIKTIHQIPSLEEMLKRSSSEVVLGQGKVANDFYDET